MQVPDDYYDPCSGPVTFFDHTKQGHIGPGFSDDLRAKLLSVLGALALPSPVLPTGTYCLTSGPRFETKAEIRALAQCGEIVGMTGAHEATLAAELGTPYAMLCIVDNMANGLAEEKLDYASFRAAVKKNEATIERTLLGVLAALAPAALPAAAATAAKNE